MGTVYIRDRFCGCLSASPPTATALANQPAALKNETMYYDETGGATPASLGLAPAYILLPAICVSLHGGGPMFVWDATAGLWV